MNIWIARDYFSRIYRWKLYKNHKFIYTISNNCWNDEFIGRFDAVQIKFTCYCTHFNNLCRNSARWYLPIEAEWRIYVFVIKISSHNWLRLWLVAWAAASHYLNQYWNSVDWTLEDISYSEIVIIIQQFLLKNVFENVVVYGSHFILTSMCQLISPWCRI